MPPTVAKKTNIAAKIIGITPKTVLDKNLACMYTKAVVHTKTLVPNASVNDNPKAVPK